jgi:hypothetical protein
MAAFSGMVSAGRVLAALMTEYHVFRTALFSIVFSLAAGQDVSVLCRAWCDAPPATASHCHQTDNATSSRVVLGKGCDEAAAPVGVLRQEVLPAGAQQAILVAGYQLAQLTIDTSAGDARWRRGCFLDKRPLATTLRI